MDTIDQSLPYILHVVAFAATIIAATGPTYKEEGGRSRPNFRGILAVAFAIVALAASVLVERSQARAAEEIAESISQGERIVFEKYLEIRGDQVWSAPQELPSGSELEFRDFDCEILADWSNDFRHVPDTTKSSETVFVGRGDPGQRYFPWTLRKSRSEAGWCAGTVRVRSTVPMGESTESH